MTKKIVLLMLPALMLSGCTLLINNGGEAGINDELYKPTVKISDEQKGETITKEAADEKLDDFTSRMSATIANLKENVPDYLTYTFKTDVDDKYNFTSINYAKEAKYLKTSSDTYTPVTLDDETKAQDKESHVIYDYLKEDKFIHATKDLAYDAETGATVEVKAYETVDEETVFNWVEKAQEMGDKAIKYLNDYRYILDNDYQSSDVTVKFASKGEGHLYASVTTSGATVELLFEDYFLTYGYAYLNARGIADLIPDQWKQYSCLATEIHVDFSSFNPEYPNLSEYIAK